MPRYWCTGFMLLLTGLLAGCRTTVPQDLPLAPSTAQVPSAALLRHLALLQPPLRHTCAPAGEVTQLDFNTTLALAKACADLSFILEDSGHGPVLLRAMGPEDALAVREVLPRFGFKRQTQRSGQFGIWTRPVSAEQRLDLRKTALAALEETALEIGQARALLLASQPSAAGKPFSPGRLVYTGEPLDVALAATSSGPHLFLACVDPASGGKCFTRGGRLFVSPENDLRLKDLHLAGTWKKVPGDAQHVALQADGHVLVLRRDGQVDELGRLQIVRLRTPQPSKIAFEAGGSAPEAVEPGLGPLVLAGHLEAAPRPEVADPDQLAHLLARQQTLQNLLAALTQPLIPRQDGPVEAEPVSHGPFVIYAELPWSAEHLKLLGVRVERSPGRTTIGPADSREQLAAALVKVLQVLRQRLALHEQNLRNAERIRDEENRINPYRRKMVSLGPQGESVEALDPTPLPQTYKPGDINADAEGFVTLPNVNKAVELAEFQAAVEEYKLLRTALERIAPNEIFPDPPEAGRK